MSYGSWFRTKSVELLIQDSESTESKLKRSLGPFQLTMLGIGAIIGAGIYTTIGTAVAGDAFRPGAGPSIILSFFLTGVVCVFTAVCYAEFASFVPISGSAYTYSYASLGEIVAWIIGWDLIIEYSVSSIAVAISWSNYFRTFIRGFGIGIPDWLAMDYRTASHIVDASGVQSVLQGAPHVFGVPVVFNLVAICIVALITFVLVWGIRQSSQFNILMVTVKIAVLVFFVFVGFKWVRPENWQPFAPNGWSGLSTGAAIVFFAFIGFDAVSTAAEETRNPRRDQAIGILLSLLICTIFYVLVAVVFTGLIPYSELKSALANEQAEPLTLALRYAMPNPGFAEGLVALGAVVAQAAVLLVMLLGQPRILFSMSRDGLLPSVFSHIHPKYKTPAFSTILTGFFVAAIASLASIEEMVDLTNVGTLFAFILVCAGVIVLRIKEPDRPRPFRVPGGWLWALLFYAFFTLIVILLPMAVLSKSILLIVAAIVFTLLRNHIFPALGILSCLYLIYYLPPTSWLRFGAWLNFGFVLYAGYGSFHSRLTGAENREAVTHKVQTYFNGAWLLLAGTLLLFLLRGLDIFQVSYKAGNHPAGIGKASAAFTQLLSPDVWLQTSWFLIVPLILNSFVFSPVIIRSSLRTWHMEGQLGRSSRISFAICTLLVLFSAYYLCGVIAFNLF